MKRTKLNIKMRLFGAVTIVAAFLFGTTPIMAYAGGYECTCEHRCTDDCINEECELCKINHELCCGADPEEVVTETEETVSEGEDDSEGSVSEDSIEEDWGPLTPDGNMTLVDDYGSPKSGKQFITVVSKSGHYFYIIIDRDDSGNETVHFLNLVDEADLLALMDDEDVESYMAAKGETEQPAETVVEKPAEETEEAEDSDADEKPQRKSNSGLLVVVLLIALGGGGAYVYFTKIKGAKKPQNEYTDPDADYNEDEDNLLDSIPDDVDEITGEDVPEPDYDDVDVNEEDEEEE